MYIPALGGIDVTGDGVADIAILKKGDESPIANLPAAVKEKIVKFYVNEGTFYLENETSGKVMFLDDKAPQRPRSFNEAKYYYFPIPIEQTVLNPKLEQPMGWK